MDHPVDKETHAATDTGGEVLKIRLSLMGRPMRVVTFQKDVVTIGRDPESDIALDNPGISRHHLRLERCAEGYYAEDLESANGTFLNDEPIRKALLRNDDVVRIGKFSLWISYERDRRSSRGDTKTVSPSTFQGTTVLSTAELEEMMTRARTQDTAPIEIHAPKRMATGMPRGRAFAVALVFFVLGIALGATATWYALH